MAGDRASQTEPRRRNPPSSDDPVRRAMDEIGPELDSRVQDVEPDPTDLRTYISVIDIDDPQHPDLDTAVQLSDEIGLYVDVFEDGLGLALGLHPGIGEVVVEDRDVILLACRLSLEDVHWAAIRAIAQVNRTPLPAQGDDGLLPVDVAFAVAEAAAPVLLENGYVERPARGEGTVYFHRLAADGLVQVVAFMRGSGGTFPDPTCHDRTMMVMAGVHVPEINRADTPQPDRPESIAPAYTTLFHSAWAAPADFPATVADHVLPWSTRTASHSAIARLIEADPDVVPDAKRAAQWTIVLRGWGYPEAAARLEASMLRRRGPIARLLGLIRGVR